MRTTFAVIALACLVAAGCAPRPAPQAGPVQSDPRVGAPVVTSPRDIRPFAADPCRGPLTDDALRALDLRVAGQAQALVTGDHACEWEGADSRLTVGLTIVVGRDVLIDTYRARQFLLFSPTTISALPAVLEQSSEQAINCNVTVGVADGQGFIVDATKGGEPSDPCGEGRRVAERVVAALPLLASK